MLYILKNDTLARDHTVFVTQRLRDSCCIVAPNFLSRSTPQTNAKNRMRSFEESKKASTLVPRIFHTNLDGDFACYGHIFDLKSTGEGFNVTAISLHLDTEETVRVSVFKKLGSSLRYSDAGQNPQWLCARSRERSVLKNF